MFSKLCLPVKVYLVVIVFSVVSQFSHIQSCSASMKEELDKKYMGICPTSYRLMFAYFVGQLLFLWLINLVCKKHGDFWAWILLFAPVIFLMIMMIGMFAVAMAIVKSTNLIEESKYS